MHSIRSEDGTPIRYFRRGHGPAILLIHGTAADHSRWAPVVSALQRHFSVSSFVDYLPAPAIAAMGAYVAAGFRPLAQKFPCFPFGFVKCLIAQARGFDEISSRTTGFGVPTKTRAGASSRGAPCWLLKRERLAWGHVGAERQQWRRTLCNFSRLRGAGPAG